MSTIEIERKFLLASDAWRLQAEQLGIAGQKMVQGYLSRDPARSVRVRIAGQSAWLTIKGISHGASRAEFEYPIPSDEAEQLLRLCEGPVINKNRYRLPIAGDDRHWEIDEFFGDNAGLLVAEIELSDEQQALPHTTWLGREVTGDNRYYNSSLSQRPFCQWSARERSEHFDKH